MVSLVAFVVALWHFLLPIFDDVTNMILLVKTFENLGGLWWVCCSAFALADVDRVLLPLVTLVLVLLPCFLLGTDEPSERFRMTVNLNLESSHFNVWPILDGFLRAMVGSRSELRSSRSLCGMARDLPVNRSEQSGFGLRLIDRIVGKHPYSILGLALFSFPHGHHLPGFNESTLRSWMMLRAVGQTLVVDSLFLALSLYSVTWENGVSIEMLSLMFSVLALLTELQYYVSEAKADMVTGEEE